jgi:hypothetical protein
MRFARIRLMISLVLLGFSIVMTGIFVGLSIDSTSLAQTDRVDPVQATIARQRQERLGQLATIFGPQVEEAQGASITAAAQADKFVRITDGHETMVIQVPADWTDIDSGPWMLNGEHVGFFLAASPDLGKLNGDLSEPGLFFGVSRTLLERYQEQGILALEDAYIQGKDKACRKQGEVAYADPFYHGRYYPYDGCRKQAGHFYFTHVTVPDTGAYAIVLRVNFPTGLRPKILEQIFSSYQVLGEPGVDEHHAP